MFNKFLLILFVFVNVTAQQQITNTITGLIKDTTYYYQAIAENDSGRSEGSIKSFYTETIPQQAGDLVGPHNLTASGSYGQINLSWTDTTADFSYGSTTNEQYFEVYGSNNGGVTYSKIGVRSQNKTDFFHTKLGDNEAWNYKVRGVRHFSKDSVVYSAFTSAATATTIAAGSIPIYDSDNFYFADAAHGGSSSNDGLTPTTPKLYTEAYFNEAFLASLEPRDSVFWANGTDGSSVDCYWMEDFVNTIQGTSRDPIVFTNYENPNYPSSEKPFVFKVARWRNEFQHVKFYNLKFQYLILPGNVWIASADTFQIVNRFTQRFIEIVKCDFYSNYSGTTGIHFTDFHKSSIYGSWAYSLEPTPNYLGWRSGTVEWITIDSCTFDGNTGEDAVGWGAVGDMNRFTNNIGYRNLEETVDIGGGSGHLIENNIFNQSTSTAPFKIHSQFSLVCDIVVRGNLLLHGQGSMWAIENVVNAKVYNNTVHGMGNNPDSNDPTKTGSFYSGYIGDRDRPLRGDPGYDGTGYYETMVGGFVKNNLFVGCMQLVGQRFIFDENNMPDSLFHKIAIEDNHYDDISGESSQARFWDGGTMFNTEVGTRYYQGTTFTTQWIDHPETSGEQYGNPLFVNPYWTNARTRGDFSLQSGSPCVNQGQSIVINDWRGEWTTDVAGNPVTGTLEIGCFIYVP